MNNQHDLLPAYILHARPYRETSFILEVFTREQGRVSLIAKGARGEKSKTKGLLQPFRPILVSYRGRSELQILTNVEMDGCVHMLKKYELLSGLYMNELLVKLIHRHDPYPLLFDKYKETLLRIEGGESLEIVLRLFEKYLLNRMGYALNLGEAVDHKVVEKEKFYHFDLVNGLSLVHRGNNSDMNVHVFPGQSLLDLHAEDLCGKESLRDAKRLMRLVFATLLGGKKN